jgi:hypothetical protein
MFAYLQRLPPVSNVPPENKIPFPLKMRFLMAAWNGLYLDKDAWGNRAPAVSIRQVQDLRRKLAAEIPDRPDLSKPRDPGREPGMKKGGSQNR